MAHNRCAAISRIDWVAGRLARRIGRPVLHRTVRVDHFRAGLDAVYEPVIIFGCVCLQPQIAALTTALV